MIKHKKEDLIENLRLQSKELNIQLTLENRIILIKLISHSILNKVLMRNINEEEKSQLIKLLVILLKSININM